MFFRQAIRRYKSTLKGIAPLATKSFSFLIIGLFFLMESDAAYGVDKYRDQIWIINSIDFSRSTLSNGGSVGGCLAVIGNDTNPPIAGTPVEVDYCGSQDAIWTLFQIQDTDYFYIRNDVNEESNFCLGVQGVDTLSSGSLAEIYPCIPGGGDTGLDNQWLPERISVDRIDPEDPPCNAYSCYQLKNRANPDLCLGVQGADNHNFGARVEVHPCRGWID